MTADITFDTTHHAQVEAFADMQRQRDRMEDERDAAILRADQADRESGELRELAEWLVSMDNPDDSAGLYARRSVTLTAIIKRATDALAAKTAPGPTFAEVRQQREQARDIAALLESEVETQRRWIDDARVLVEGLPCSKPPLECRRCRILRALRGAA